MPTEESLVETFDAMADANDGRFLDDFDMVSLMMALTIKPGSDAAKNPRQASKEITRTANQSRGIIFALSLPKSADAHYAGKGVKRDQPDRPIFWYKPEGSDKYRVVYADLTVKDASRAPEIAGAVLMNDPTRKPVSMEEQVKALMRKNSPRADASGKVLTDLKSIAVAMVNYNDAKRSFPPAAIADKDGQPLLSWRVKLLPFLNQEDLYKQFHLDEPWDSEHNLPLVKKMPDCYASSGRGQVGRQDRVSGADRQRSDLLRHRRDTRQTNHRWLGRHDPDRRGRCRARGPLDQARGFGSRSETSGRGPGEGARILYHCLGRRTSGKAQSRR